jgi:neuraminyllactose-binding hemagglutinin
MKHIYSALTLIVFALLYCGSATQKKVPTLLVTPDFDFSPPSTAEPGSTGIKIALFEPMYQGNFAYSDKSPFKQFRSSMGKDFEEILSARGFIIKGPYDEYDLMTYSDKNECELGLFVDIVFNINETSGGWKFMPTSNGCGGTTTYGAGAGAGAGFSHYEGTLNISGKITLYISETFTRQKLMVKSLTIPQTDLTVKGEKRYVDKQGGNTIPLDDPGVHNPIANSLSEFYKSTMQRAWDLLVKDDLIRLKDQVPEIRKNAGFIKH